MKASEWFEKTFQMKGGDSYLETAFPSSVDVIIAIGTDVAKDGKGPSPQSKMIALVADRIFRSGNADNILFCGGYEHKGLREYYAMYMSRYGNRETPQGVWFEGESNRTYLNADNTLEIMKNKGWDSAIVVCQQWHARRVRATFKKRWHGSGKKFYVLKAFSPYVKGANSQKRFDNFWRFLFWDTLAFVVSKIKGYC